MRGGARSRVPSPPRGVHGAAPPRGTRAAVLSSEGEEAWAASPECASPRTRVEREPRRTWAGMRCAPLRPRGNARRLPRCLRFFSASGARIVRTGVRAAERADSASRHGTRMRHGHVRQFRARGDDIDARRERNPRTDLRSEHLASGSVDERPGLNFFGDWTSDATICVRNEEPARRNSVLRGHLVPFRFAVRAARQAAQELNPKHHTTTETYRDHMGLNKTHTHTPSLGAH